MKTARVFGRLLREAAAKTARVFGEIIAPRSRNKPMRNNFKPRRFESVAIIFYPW